MDHRNIEDMFYKLVELYATIKADVKHLATKTDLVEHSVECPAVKKHKILIAVGALLSGAFFVLGIVSKSFF